jgi:hypothetical protein
MVPSNFVIDAIDHLASLEASERRTYQLADPRPLNVAELIDVMCQVTERRGLRVPLPRRLTQLALERVGPLQRFVGIPAAAVPYFAHPTHYDTTNAGRELAGSGIECPAVPTYLAKLVDFLRDHRDAEVGVMV